MRAWNFSAGPAAIPEEVLQKAKQELVEYGSQQASIMEISHRSNAYEAVGFGARDNLRSCLLYTSPSPRDLSTSRMPSSA